MLNTKSFISVDFGAGSLKLAEFELNESGGLRLKQYGFRSLGAEGAQESTREAVMQKALQELLAEKGIKSRDVNVCAPGFHVFSKFVKLPPVEPAKVTQIIQYEAQQNVPFPLAEVVWDYQILGTTAGGELEVLLVAIKSDIVEGLFRVTEAAGLRLQLADVSPAALCNAFRYNYSDLEDCTMLLDIGAKTSNLLFFEKGKVYSRSINLGANTITQDFANESKLPFAEAEKKKIAEGFVSLGGAYEEPENAHQAAISKIARQFMTRLHIQVNQTLQFYRGQQGGSAPQRLFLSGGASIMPYAAQFFQEKLNLPVEYFNPLRNVDRDPSLNLEQLQLVTHQLGEVVGLGLRNLAHCPVELNLMPESTLNWVNFNQKKPYLLATVFSLAAVVFASALLFNKLNDINQAELANLDGQIVPLTKRKTDFQKALGDLEKSKTEAAQIADWIDDRYYWGEVLSQLHTIMVQVENETSNKLHTATGVWIENFTTDGEAAPDQPMMAMAPGFPAAAGGGMARDAAWMRRYGSRLPGGGAAAPAAPAAEAAPAAGATAGTKTKPVKPAATNEVDTITVMCRAVDVSATGGPSATTDMAFAVQNALREDPLFDKEETKLTAAGLSQPDERNTFTFSVTVKLKKPLKL